MSKRPQKPDSDAAPREYRKPRADVYTILLLIAVAIIIVATVALWNSMKEYDNMIKGGPNPVWHRPAIGAALDVQRGTA